jgi:predicted DNA-binding protein
VRLSQIKEGEGLRFGEKVTFRLPAESKRILDRIADSKHKTVSDVVREVMDEFLLLNQEEIKSL